MGKYGPTRRIEQGDRSPSLTAAGIERFEVTMATETARQVKLNAVRDVLHNAHPEELTSVAEWLMAVLDGTSADDRHELRSALEHEDDVPYGLPPLTSDDELVADWQNSVYPYANLLSRKSYEKQ